MYTHIESQIMISKPQELQKTVKLTMEMAKIIESYLLDFFKPGKSKYV